MKQVRPSMTDITIPLAFFAGIISFLSPCILPLVPAFISYLSGISINEIQKSKKARLIIFLNAVFFVLGFSLVFSLLGILLSGLLASIAYDTRLWLSRIGGVVIVFFGLYLLGILKIPFLEKEHKAKPRKFHWSYLTSFIFGIAFAAGWTPCVGPVLGSILTLAIITPGAAFNLLFAYSLGLGMPFLLVGLFTSQASTFMKRSSTFMKPFRLLMGILLIAIGILVFTGYINLLANFFFIDFMPWDI